MRRRASRPSAPNSLARRLMVAAIVVIVASPLMASAALAGSTPPNNLFAAAEPIGPLPATKNVDTSGASSELGEPNKCATPSVSVWYRITLSHTTTIRVDSIGSDYNTAIAVWQGSSLGQLTPIVCNLTIDSQGPDKNENALVAFTAKAHTRYSIQVMGDGGIGGDLTLHVRSITPLPNDAFGDATRIASLPFHASANNRNASTQPGEPRECAFNGATRWFRFTPSHDMTVQADTFGSGIDTVLAVLTGSKVDALTYRACNDGTSQNGTAIDQSSVTWRAKAGTRYAIQVGGFASENGPLELHVKQGTPPVNDDFGSSTLIAALPVSLAAGNRTATHQTGEPASECSDDIGLDQSRWYRFTAATDDDLEVSVTSGTFAPGYVAVWTGASLGTLVEIDCSEDAVTFTPTPGTTYRFQVAMVGGHSGPMLVQLALAP